MNTLASNMVLATAAYSQDFADSFTGIVSNGWSGEQFTGGMPQVADVDIDLESARRRSRAAFTTSLYARGLLTRLVTNEIHTGIELEASPPESLSTLDEESLNSWDENVEDRFYIWSRTKGLADQKNELNFFEMQAQARLEALIDGDILCIMNIDPETQLPKITHVLADYVTGGDSSKIKKGHEIIDGVEIDSNGKHVAYWISTDQDLEQRRIPAWSKDGSRRIAWLYYSTARRCGKVRGEPLLTTLLQSIVEMGTYRGAVQRRANIQSFLSIFIKKDASLPGGFNAAAAGVRNSSTPAPTAASPGRIFKTAQWIPGTVVEELNQGEDVIYPNNSQSDMQYQAMEDAFIAAIAWACEMPPEILKLSFNSNYSASQAANNEFNSYLSLIRDRFGANYNQPVYEQWLIGETLTKRIVCAGLIESLRDPSMYVERGVWFQACWVASIKPTTDLKKLTAGYTALIANGLITRERAMKELGTGSFRRDQRKMKREAELMSEVVKASSWMLPETPETVPSDTPKTPESTGGKNTTASTAAVEEMVTEMIENHIDDAMLQSESR
jgi:capsid protein